jgi:DNA-binding transcriptional regulator LsrR (DeoR family)
LSRFDGWYHGGLREETKMTAIDRIDDVLLSDICQRFVNGQGATKISKWLETEHGLHVSREQIYRRVLPMGIERGVFKVLPTPNRKLEEELSERYGKNREDIHVVNTLGQRARNDVASAAADLTLSLIKKLGAWKPWVRIGLGGGDTVRRTIRELALRVRSEAGLPNLGLHVVSSGFDAHMPLSAPVTFLSYFENVPAKVDYVGLFAPPIVPTRDYQQVKRWPGVEESFKCAGNIDIVLTSLATASDEHGALRQFLKVGRKEGFETAALRRAGWTADLQYSPYSRLGPIDVDAGVRAVTLFELGDLKRLVQREKKHVIVVASPCATCGNPKTEAVRPLLERKELKLWTHLVVDLETARELLSEQRSWTPDWPSPARRVRLSDTGPNVSA